MALSGILAQVSVVLALAAAPVAAMARPNFSKLARQCDSLSKNKACVKLANLALRDRDASTRLAAAANLHDLRLLGVVATRSPEAAVREQALRKVVEPCRDKRNSCGVLAEVAIKARDAGTRAMALANLADQSALLKVAAESTDAAVRNAALQKIALTGKNTEVRAGAVQRLTDERMLAQVAAEVAVPEVWQLAVARLADQALLTQLAESAKDADVRVAAVRRLTDQTTVARMAVDDSVLKVRQAALSGLTDAFLRAKAVQERQRKDAATREMLAAVKTGDMAKMEALLRADPKLVNARDDWGVTPLHEGVRLIEKRVQPVPSSTRSLGSSGFSVALIREVYAGSSRPGPGPIDRTPGPPKTADKARAEWLLAKGADVNARDDSDQTPLHIAAANGDAAMVGLLLANHADRNAKSKSGTPLAVAARLGYADAVGVLTDNGRRLAAIAREYRAFIESGYRGFEDMLTRALQVLGDRAMAVEYLNCGNSALADAARIWAANHGYVVRSGAGGGVTVWGRR